MFEDIDNIKPVYVKCNTIPTREVIAKEVLNITKEVIAKEVIAKEVIAKEVIAKEAITKEVKEVPSITKEVLVKKVYRFSHVPSNPEKVLKGNTLRIYNYIKDNEGSNLKSISQYIDKKTNYTSSYLHNLKEYGLIIKENDKWYLAKEN